MINYIKFRIKNEIKELLEERNLKLCNKTDKEILSVPWRKEFLAQVEKRILPDTSLILEIGDGDGALSLELSKRHRDCFFYGIDISGFPRKNINYSHFNMSATNLLFKDNCVDLVISHNVFEHIQGLKKAVSEMIRVLKPGGKLYTFFAPIWSSAFGHHYYEDDGSKVFSIFPEYSHLYFKKEELRKIIFKHIGHFKKERIIAENYIFGNGCNKLFPEDYRNLFINNNGLKIINFVEIDKHYHNEKTTGPLPIKLINLYKNIPPKDFKIVGFEVEGIKEWKYILVDIKGF